jgi:dolichol-phosphate mannosyltransferase
LVQLLLTRSAEAAQRRPALSFALLAALGCLLFYSLSGCKRAGYILPALPPLALALGCALDFSLTAKAGLARAALAVVLLAGIGGGLLAVGAGLWSAAAGAALTVLLLSGGALTHYWAGGRPAATWFGVGALTLLLLWLGVHQLLPGYARRFALRGQVRRFHAVSNDARVPVLCYPHRWDSVTYYLGRDDVLTFTPARRAEMVRFLCAQPQALVFVKTQHCLRDLVAALPDSLEFVPHARRGVVTSGLVRQRTHLSSNRLALHGW